MIETDAYAIMVRMVAATREIVEPEPERPVSAGWWALHEDEFDEMEVSDVWIDPYQLQ